MIVALRRVIRAVDLHSRHLVDSHGLTGPQALILKTVSQQARSAGEIATAVSLSQATVTDILNRLERRDWVTRTRDSRDRRRVVVTITPAGKAVVAESPPLLQETFTERFVQLEEWEQLQLLSSLHRIAALMDAQSIDASPVLSSGSVRASSEALGGALSPAPEDSDR